jgi:hypothetical protein
MAAAIADQFRVPLETLKKVLYMSRRSSLLLPSLYLLCFPLMLLSLPQLLRVGTDTSQFVHSLSQLSDPVLDRDT